jgi:purine catabolism regulator
VRRTAVLSGSPAAVNARSVTYDDAHGTLRETRSERIESSRVSAMMRLGSLLGHEEFELVHVSGDDNVRDMAVRGAHVLEVEEPLRWVPPGWIILTTGIRLWHRPEEQRRLIAELSNGQIAALGFASGVIFDELPKALVDEARSRNFTVFEVPVATSFRDLVRFVDGELLSEDVQTMRRSIAIRDRLLESVAEPEPDSAIIGRLAQVLRCDVTLFDPTGNVVEASNRSRTAWHWEKIQSLAPTAGPTEILRTHRFQAIRVVLDGFPARWIAAEAGDASLGPAIVERALRDSAGLMTALLEMRRFEVSAFQERCTDLLLDLTGGLDDSVTARRSLIARGKELGVDVDHPNARFAEGLTISGEAVQIETVRAWTAELAAGASNVLLGISGEAVLMLLPPAYDIEKLAQQAGRWGLRMGVGSASGGLAGLGRSRGEAGLAALRARREQRDLVDHASLGIIDWMILQTPPAVLRQRAMSLLGPLEFHPELRQTLNTYIEQRLNASETARLLHLHKNSLGYRLRRIEAMLAVDLHDPRDISEVQVAMTVLELGRST